MSSTSPTSLYPKQWSRLNAWLRSKFAQPEPPRTPDELFICFRDERKALNLPFIPVQQLADAYASLGLTFPYEKEKS
jgi:hypothetical protein